MLKTESSRGYRTTGALLVLSLLVQIPFLDRGLSFLDEGSILAIADGLRQGERLYADRVTPLAPLTYELMAALLGLFGPHLLVGRLLQALVFTGCVLLIHRILLVFVDCRPALLGALAVLVVKPLGFPLWTIANYSQLAFFFCLASILAVLSYLPRQRFLWLMGAGLGIGLTVITKQNLAAFLGLVVAAAILLDWLHNPERRAAGVVVRAGALLCGAAVPILVIVALYAARGTLDDLVGRTVIGLSHLTAPYQVALPGLGRWVSLQPDELGRVSFTYLPSPLLQLAWQGRLNLHSPWLLSSVELSVKLAYFAPLVFLGWAGLALLRGGAGAAERSRSEFLLIALFAAAAYLSMLYRADWTHLMNVYPAFVLLAAVLLAQGAGGRAWWRRLALGLWVIWFGAGVAMSWVVLTVYESPVVTPRGRLLDTPATTHAAQRVLAHLDQQPSGDHILLMRAEPLYYFLSGRRIPIRFDLVMPGVIDMEDEQEIARGLPTIDQILYNPKVLPTVSTPLTAYAPVTAAALAAGFRVGEVLSDTAVVLVPADEGRRQEQTVVDLWEGTGDPREGAGSGHDSSAVGHGPSVRRESWMMYRVIGATIEGQDVPTCFSVRHFVGPSEAISVIPMPHPDLWAAEAARHTASQLRFNIEVETASAPPQIVSLQQCTSIRPGVPVYASLASFAGENVTVRFCVSAHDAAAVPLRVGWAEPKIVREERRWRSEVFQANGGS